MVNAASPGPDAPEGEAVEGMNIAHEEDPGVSSDPPHEEMEMEREQSGLGN